MSISKATEWSISKPTMLRTRRMLRTRTLEEREVVVHLIRVSLSAKSTGIAMPFITSSAFVAAS